MYKLICKFGGTGSTCSVSSYGKRWNSTPLFHFNGISIIINHDLSPSAIDCTPPASQPRTYTWVRRMLILRSTTIVGHWPTTWKWPFVVQSLVTFPDDSRSCVLNRYIDRELFRYRYTLAISYNLDKYRERFTFFNVNSFIWGRFLSLNCYQYFSCYYSAYNGFMHNYRI